MTGRDVNVINRRNLYNFLNGATLSIAAAPQSSFNQDDVASSEGIKMNAPTATTTPQAPAPLGSDRPFLFMIIIVIALFALMWIAQRFGSEGNSFSNVKLSAYNIVVIALAAAIGLVTFKAVFNRFPIPGVTTFFNAA